MLLLGARYYRPPPNGTGGGSTRSTEVGIA